VVDGLRAAGAPWACVMDGDLQHRPEFVPALVQRATAGDVDLVVASRYTVADAPSGLGRTRAAGSRLGCAVARASLPAVGRVADPLSGFFLVRRAALDLDALEPNGFKVLVEILARAPSLRVAEVPYALAPRAAGRSKAGPREAVRLLGLLRARRRSAAAPPPSPEPRTPPRPEPLSPPRPEPHRHEPHHQRHRHEPHRPEPHRHERCA
jgi:dolichol-phosphate mannosyltransferase